MFLACCALILPIRRSQRCYCTIVTNNGFINRKLGVWKSTDAGRERGRFENGCAFFTRIIKLRWRERVNDSINHPRPPSAPYLQVMASEHTGHHLAPRSAASPAITNWPPLLMGTISLNNNNLPLICSFSHLSRPPLQWRGP